MKYDFNSKLMWNLFEGSFYREFQRLYGEKYASLVMRNAKREYIAILGRTEGIGKNIKENPFIFCFLNCAMLISIYKLVDDRISAEKLGLIYEDVMKDSILLKIFCKSKNTFNKKWQVKRYGLGLESQKRKYKNNWVFDLIHDKDEKSYGINFYECGICKLCKQEECPELAKQMCKIDYLMAKYMKANLKRTKTIANGDEMCDFWYSRNK